MSRLNEGHEGGSVPSNASSDSSSDASPDRARKSRNCLRCGTGFESEWSGERICPRCKGSNTWRSGAPLRSHSPGAE